MSTWTSEEVAMAREVWLGMFPNAAPEQFMSPLDCGTLPATTVVALRAVRLAMDAAKARPGAGPVIELIPAEGLWLWECRVGGERCHTGSTFHHAGSAGDAAARHVTEKHNGLAGIRIFGASVYGTCFECQCGHQETDFPNEASAKAAAAAHLAEGHQPTEGGKTS